MRLALFSTLALAAILVMGCAPSTTGTTPPTNPPPATNNGISLTLQTV